MSLNYLNDGIGELWAAQRSAIGLEWLSLKEKDSILEENVGFLFSIGSN